MGSNLCTTMPSKMELEQMEIRVTITWFENNFQKAKKYVSTCIQDKKTILTSIRLGEDVGLIDKHIKDIESAIESFTTSYGISKKTVRESIENLEVSDEIAIELLEACFKKHDDMYSEIYDECVELKCKYTYEKNSHSVSVC